MPLGNASSNIWLTGYLATGEMYQYLISKVIMQEKSDFQDICIVELENNSKALLLNNKLQPTTLDGHMYYEPLVHVPFISYQNPESILIIGAGEGASAREALKWKSVKKITIVEMDKLVVESCIKYLPDVSKGSFKNNRVKIIYHEAHSFVKQEDKKYDVIICDLCPQIGEQNGKSILDKEFLLNCKSLLNKNGFMCLQIGDSPFKKSEVFLNKIRLMKSIFRSAKIYCSWVPSLRKNLSFVLLRKDKIIENMPFDEVDSLLEKQLLDDLIFLNARAYIGLMNPAKYIQEYE
jgi:spermidine synthase